jgi:hypothetical protein
MALPTKSIWLSTQRCNSDCRSAFELERCGVALLRPARRPTLAEALHCCAVAAKEWTLRSSAAWQNQAP